MKNLPDKQQEVTPESWSEIYAQHGIKLSEQDEADITERLTEYFELLERWNSSLNQ